MRSLPQSKNSSAFSTNHYTRDNIFLIEMTVPLQVRIQHNGENSVKVKIQR